MRSEMSSRTLTSPDALRIYYTDHDLDDLPTVTHDGANNQVIMEGDEMEMTIEELRTWIRTKVKENKQISDMTEKCNLLQSLLERKQNQAIHLMKLCKSVAACEAVVKKQYSLLGWDYREVESDDDDDNITGCGNTPSEFVRSESPVPSSPTTSGPTPWLPNLRDSKNFYRDDSKKVHINLKRQPVVVLTRLSPSKISCLRSPAPQDYNSEDESLNSLDSDTQWEPDDDFNYSDSSISSYDTGSQKRRKIYQKNWDFGTPQVRSNTGAKNYVPKSTGAKNYATKSTGAKNYATRSTGVKNYAVKSTGAWSYAAKRTSAKNYAAKSTGSKNYAAKSTRAKNYAAKSTGAKNYAAKSTGAKNYAAKSTGAKNYAAKSTGAKNYAAKSTGTKSNAAKILTLQANVNTKSNTMNTWTPQANTEGATSVTMVSTLCQDSDRAMETQARRRMPEGKICVNMNVLAKSRGMDWKQGKIVEIVTKEDGRLKYKISFQDNRKSLVSGHHIAFDCNPIVDQLFVGARVVVKCKDVKPCFLAGIVAEVPQKKNLMRFLVFTDDHTPIYVGLPSLHLVCKPLADPLDDIPNDIHKNFMKEYLKVWPYPPRMRYTVGDIINAELNGFQQKCEVLKVDCSLIKVIFQKDQHKDWIYRGSIRLEHIINEEEHSEK
uniref:uncharacterized protein LOC124074563 isoform X2 n=1 Tax=Scatophagus argus TaxID=75038 RepID=UPI001ED85E96|nr:uncharacterized protein LOC124074563 isoform X2 [Scatophagus argus]